MNLKRAGIFILTIAVIAGGWIFYTKQQTQQKTLGLQCGTMNFMLPESFASLSKPADLPQLDARGCYASSKGCACAKLGPDSKEGIVLGISESDTTGIDLPSDAEGQKMFLTQYANVIESNATTSASLSTEIGTFQGNQSLAVSQIATIDEKTFKAQNIFIIRNGVMYEVSFQSTLDLFSKYWPELADSLQRATFTK
ncbi:MAG: hypothetical protein K0S38_447 [Candidatus Paceibacter sp.]|jgi:hypothetical protein|nr:hypothetical protein [Candidatus Paceibacter sp.]